MKSGSKPEKNRDSKKSRKKNVPDPYKHRSSKIDRVLIELHDYSYYHGPSDLENPDNRFIGREKEIDKLKSELTDTSRKSGAYLVTGYRGMGKTSFINKVLEQIIMPGKPYRSIVKLLGVVFVSMLISFLLYFISLTNENPGFDNALRHTGDYSLYLLSAFYLAGFSLVAFKTFMLRFRKEGSLFTSDIIRKIIYGLILVISPASVKNVKHKRNFIISGYIILVVLASMNCLQEQHKIITEAHRLFYFYFFVFVAQSLFTVLVSWFEARLSETRTQKKKDEHASKGKKISFYNEMKRFINFSDHISIKLNLGYSDLKEIDILKLIASTIKATYSKYRKRLSFGMLLRFSLAVIVMLLANTIYHRTTFGEISSNLRNTSGLTTYFPSQYDVFYSDTENKYLRDVVRNLRKKKNPSPSDYYVWTKMYEDLHEKAVLTSNYKKILTYLNLADKKLFEFLSLNDIKNLNISKFDSVFLLKKNAYFNLSHNVRSLEKQYNGYNYKTEDLIGRQSQETILEWCRKLATPEIKMNDIYLLLSYWQENPKARDNIMEANLRLEFLFPLNRMEEVRREYEAFSPLKKRVIAITGYIDYVLSSAYYYFTQTTRINVIKRHPLLFPYNLDYIYFIYLFIFLLATKLAITLINVQSVSRRKILRKINLLNDIIDARLTIERSSTVNIPKAAGFFSHKKTKAYPQDDEREIEKFLIEILDDISQLPVYSFRAQFIFIFDELDKIDPRIGANEETSDESLGSGSDAIRKRQQAVMSLLSNLKYFLSTAQAKFIFIAGRELYDAFLADISDRHFRIGSIFHDVIYINSFLSDLHPREMEDITSRTEQFVCQFLFPKDYCTEHLNLKNYNRYLIKTIDGFRDNDEDDLACQKREKVVYLLQQFIIYLNHVSTGAPSKLTSYFENFIVTGKSAFNQTKKGLIVGRKNEEKLYLFFDFYRQYQIGVVNYLLTPVNFSINKNIRHYSDKLIVSASFLHDHLFKFHRNAFSWRDLEATPEMIDVNKNPELRDFLGEVIHFMVDTHIHPIINGLYDFKFPKSIAQEIVFLSHISQEASATFNFTLDESRATKQHFHEHYLKLRQNYQSSIKNSNEYIYSLASSILTLADICFFDEDLGQAVTYYLDSIQPIRDLEVGKVTNTQLVLLIRNMLKLGHALEKRRTFDVAYLTYHEAFLKVSEFIQSKESQKPDLLLENVRFFYQPLLARFYLTEKTSFEGIAGKDIDQIETDFNTMIESVTEKQSRIKAEVYNKIGDILYYKNKGFGFETAETEIVETGADSQCPFGRRNKFNRGCCSCEACKYYRKGLLSLLGISPDISGTLFLEMIGFIKRIKLNELEFSSLELTIIAMAYSDLGDTFLTCIEDTDMPDRLLSISRAKIEAYNFHARDLVEPVNVIVLCYKAASYLYRKAGDHKSFAFQNTKLLYLIRYFLLKDPQRQGINKFAFRETVKSISRESINGIFSAYEHIHSYEIHRFQNILSPEEEWSLPEDIHLNRISINTEISEISILCKELEILAGVEDGNTISNGVIRMINPYSQVSSMFIRLLSLRLKSLSNLVRFRELLGSKESIRTYPGYSSILKSYFRYFDRCTESDINELEFLIRDSIFCNHEILKIIYTFGFSYRINHSMAAETHESLYIWCKYYWMYLNITDFIKGNHEIAYSLRLLESNVDSLRISNPDIEILLKRSKLKQELGKIIERDNLQFIMPSYQCEKAISEYYATIESHNQGLAYKNLIENMNYLNDDFNDRQYHFAIALERINIQNADIRGRIHNLKRDQSHSRIKDILSYQGVITKKKNRKMYCLPMSRI